MTFLFGTRLAAILACVALVLALTVALISTGSPAPQPAKPVPYAERGEQVTPPLQVGFFYGLENGRFPPSALHTILGGRLNLGAAPAWNTMQLASHHYIRGPPIYPNGNDASYRTYDQQVYWKSYWCGQGACYNAATPGTSNHGWGRAVDMPCSLRWIISRIGGQFGWRWGEAPAECWHVTYYGGFHRPDPGPSLLYPTMQHGSGGYGQSFEVHYVQALLQYHRIPVVWTHGFFTNGTARAVKLFQRRRHLRADGTVGKSTWIQLRSKKR